MDGLARTRMIQLCRVPRLIHAGEIPAVHQVRVSGGQGRGCHAYCILAAYFVYESLRGPRAGTKKNNALCSCFCPLVFSGTRRIQQVQRYHDKKTRSAV